MTASLKRRLLAGVAGIDQLLFTERHFGVRDSLLGFSELANVYAGADIIELTLGQFERLLKDFDLADGQCVIPKTVFHFSN